MLSSTYRKNWIHIGSEEAGPNIATSLSIFATGRRLQINLHDYFSGVDYVSGDKRQIMFSLLKHLRSLGHERFGLLVNEPTSFQMIVKRMELFQLALKVFDLPEGTIIDCQTLPGERSPILAYEGCKSSWFGRRGNCRSPLCWWPAQPKGRGLSERCMQLVSGCPGL